MMLSACALPPPAPAPPAVAPPAAAPPFPSVAPHEGRPYDVRPEASLLTIRVYRGGALASAGHNHVIASHDVSGTIYVPAELLRSSFELHIPVATLTVDEPQLRAQQGGADFPPGVSEEAKAGTRRNMLGPALLDGAQHAEIVLRAARLEPLAGNAAAGPATATAWVQSTVRGQVRTFAVPVHYQLADGALQATGEFPLRQSELGLTPFSALLGALQVQDEMQVSFHLLAHAAPVNSGEAGARAAR
jgi:YceI-like domain